MNLRIHLKSGTSIDVRLKQSTTVEEFFDGLQRTEKEANDVINLFLCRPDDPADAVPTVCILAGNIAAFEQID